MTAQQEFHSTGHLCQLLQRSPREITAAAQELQLIAALKINGVVHFDGNATIALAAHFRNSASDRSTIMPDLDQG